jgi:hypothetical protein
MKPIEQLVFGPSRAVYKCSEGWRVVVTPPAITKLPGASIILDDDQYERYQRWLDSRELIQHALPELTKEEREILITGIGPDDFNRIAREAEYD